MKLLKAVLKDYGTLGGVLAVVISWSINQSILWAILHGSLGWLYVLYYVIVGQK